MALTNKLTAIADSIRTKTGSTNKLTLDEMPTAISNISSGGGDLPEEAFNITGNCKYKFAYGGWDWFINNYGNRVTTSSISSVESMFENSKVQIIPFSINCSPESDITMWKFFWGCSNLKSIPQINNAYVNNLGSLFYNCSNLKEIDDNMFKTWDFSNFNNSSSRFCGNIFQNCNSLRKIPMSLISNLTSKGTSGSFVYTNNAFTGCACLDEITDLPLPSKAIISNASSLFSGIVTNCYRLKRMKFATNNDGTPLTANYKNALIDFTNVGFYTVYSGISTITDYNSGITKDKNVCYASDGVTDLTQLSDIKNRYNELKDDLDWFSCTQRNITYEGSSINAACLFSRYNHDSAVETINSLHDTSEYLATAGGTNTIKFTGYSGAETDGGAINTLTEAEIAVAAAKGWTVTLV